MHKKNCRNCGQPFPDTLEYFDRLPTDKKGNVRTSGVCRECRRIYRKNYYHNNREVYRQKQNAWEAKQPKEYRKQKSLRKRAKQKGITKEIYQRMLSAQEGGCAVCGAHDADSVKSLSIDHCHTTGVVRGLLCSSCNLAAGLLKDSPEYALNMAGYLYSGRLMVRVKDNGYDPLQVWLGEGVTTK